MSVQINASDDFVLRPTGIPATPFCKWAGGKRQLLGDLRRFYPPRFQRYFEPFVGGGSVFLDLAKARLNGRPTFLSDANGDLIGCYLMIRAHVDEVIRFLEETAQTGPPDTARYNAVRDKFNATRAGLFDASNVVRAADYTPELAAQFVYLNRCGFNGLFRVNRRGGFTDLTP